MLKSRNVKMVCYNHSNSPSLCCREQALREFSGLGSYLDYLWTLLPLEGAGKPKTAHLLFKHLFDKQLVIKKLITKRD